MITIENLSKKYVEHTIIENFDYSFEKGKSYALIGPSGSGKSTLLNMIGRLENPSGGTIKIDGLDLSKIKEQTYFLNYLGYLFQNYGLIDNQSIFKNLDLAFINKKTTKSDKKIKMNDALKKVGLADIPLERNIFSLSGGEQQRVAIAKLVIKNPLIILADEPTGALDYNTGEMVADLILNLVDENKTIIIATHNPSICEKCDAIIELNKF